MYTVVVCIYILNICYDAVCCIYYDAVSSMCICVCINVNIYTYSKSVFKMYMYIYINTYTYTYMRACILFTCILAGAQLRQ